MRSHENSRLAAGLAFSALVHLLVLLASPWFVRFPELTAPAGPISRTPEGIRVGRIAPAAEAPAEAGPETPPEPPTPEEPPGPEPDAPVPTEEPRPAAPSPAALLAPTSPDLRLWTVPEAFSSSAGLEGRAAAEVRIGVLADSVAAEAEAERRGRDWTYTDAEGRRWGASPDCLHLGVRSLCQVSGRPKWLRDWQFWGWQVEHAKALDLIEERARAIRERADAERARKRAGGG